MTVVSVWTETDTTATSHELPAPNPDSTLIVPNPRDVVCPDLSR